MFDILCAVIVCVFLIDLVLSFGAGMSEASYGSEIASGEDADDDDEDSEPSVYEKVESAYIAYELLKAADREEKIRHAECGKCLYCRFSHKEERDGFLTTNMVEVYECSQTYHEIDDTDLYMERYCPYYES